MGCNLRQPSICLAILTIIFINLQCQNTQGAITIDVHTGSDFLGIGRKINISQCSNLPDELAGKVRSVHTRDQCVHLFSVKNCTGNSVELSPISPSHNNLDYWNFKNIAKSAGSCHDTCFMEAPENLFDEPINVTIFSERDFKGRSTEIRIEGCTPVPTDFINYTQSINSSGHCLQFYNRSDCITEGPHGYTVELGPSFLAKAGRWGHSQTRAISRCRRWCPEYARKVNKSPKKGEVKLYRHGNFQAKLHGGRACCEVISGYLEKQVGLEHPVSELVFPNEDLATSTPPTPPPTIPGRKTNSTNGSNHKGGNGGLSPLTIAIVAIIAVLVLCIIARLIIKRKFGNSRGKDNNNLSGALSEKEVEEFLGGFGMAVAGSGCGALENTNDYSVEMLAQNKPYDNAYETARDKIKFDSRVPLGMGEFGMVYKGTVRLEQAASSSSNESCTVENLQVAIKAVNPTADVQGLRSLLKEVKVILHTGSHPNIAHMLGCCTENLRKGEVLVLMEFCSHGSLESYLLQNRSSFLNLVTKGKLEKCDATNFRTSYKNVQNGSAEKSFDIFQLLEWCTGVARGMEFLANAKIVHSDLAARNVLLDDKLLAKISDFGLSRQLYSYSQYMKKNLEPLPWRWLALESLKRLEFSTNSDVWSFGVLCWEMFTLGDKPYPGLTWNEAFISNLEDGMRLAKPKYTTFEVYNLMIRCWDEEPSRRPTFTEIHEEIQELIAVSGGTPQK